MLATLNLQLPALELGTEATDFQGIDAIEGTALPREFANLLEVRVADAALGAGPGGETLPLSGNTLPLPEPEVEITVDGVALEEVSEGGSPVLPVADTQPWEALVSPPGIELREISPDVSAVASDPANETASLLRNADSLAATGHLPAAVQLVGNSSQLAEVTAPKPQIEPAQVQTPVRPPQPEPLPAIASDAIREVVAEPRDARATPLPAGLLREARQVAAPGPAPTAKTSASDETPVLSERQARVAPPALQPASPVTEETGLETLRPVSQPIATAQPATQAFVQPGPLVNLSPNPTAQVDSSFASTLQQQLPDLIETPVRDTAWGNRIGERVVMMAGNQLKMAEIRLTPAELGPVRIQVSVEDGAANVTFQAQHAVTREALEQAMPRLREMLAESGLSLGQTSVGEQNVAGNRDGGDRGDSREVGTPGEFAQADEFPEDESRLVRKHDGLLDTFV